MGDDLISLHNCNPQEILAIVEREVDRRETGRKDLRSWVGRALDNAKEVPVQPNKTEKEEALQWARKASKDLRAEMDMEWKVRAEELVKAAFGPETQFRGGLAKQLKLPDGGLIRLGSFRKCGTYVWAHVFEVVLNLVEQSLDCEGAVASPANRIERLMRNAKKG